MKIKGIGILGIFLLATFFSCGCISIEDKPVYESRAIYEQQEIFDTQAIYTQEPVYNQQAVYVLQPIYDQQAIYEDRYDITLRLSGLLCSERYIVRDGLTYNEYMEWYYFKEDAILCSTEWAYSCYSIHVGYEDVFSHYEDVFSHYEDVFSHYEDVFSHFESIFVGYEDVIVGYEDVLVGYK